MIDRSKDLIISVSGYSTETYNQVPGSGKVWNVYEVAASLPPDIDIKAEIKFGTEVIFVCHANWPNEKLNKSIIGDGSKILSMRLVNDTGQSETMRLLMKAEEI